MADGLDVDVDVSALSAAQQEALEQYTAVTNQEAKDAIPVLRRSEWNVQIAIAKFYDGDGPDLVAEAIAAQNAPPPVSARHENLQESFITQAGHPARAPRANRTDAAPRIVPRATVVRQPPFLLAIIFAPFHFGYRIAAGLFRTVFYFLSFLPRSFQPRALTSAVIKSGYGRRQLLPRDTAARFKREFDEQYGDNSLPFLESSYAAAYDTAKKELKFLLVILLAPEHDDTESFVRDTLLSAEVVDLIRDPANSIILWGGSVLDSEAYQVSNEYNCTKFPWSALVCLTPREGSTRMGTIKRLAGPMTGSAYAAELRAAMDKYAPDLDGVRAERAAQEMSRSIRNEQDSAYERSLAADRERARQQRAAEEARAAAEKKAAEEAAAAELLRHRRAEWKAWRATTIAPEPPAAAKQDVVRLALKMPESMGGQRVRRTFDRDSTVEDLYAFVECYDVLTQQQQQQQDGSNSSQVEEEEELDEKKTAAADVKRPPEGYEHEYKFRIASLMPREVHEPSKTATLGEKIGKSGNLIVEEVIDEDSDDGE